LSGDCLPAAVAIHEKIGEENAGNNFASGIHHPVQAAYKAGVTIDVGVHVLEAIRSVARLGCPGERFCAIVHSAIYVGILELIREKAADRLYVIVIERLGPFFFLLKQRLFISRLCPGTRSSPSQWNTASEKQYCDPKIPERLPSHGAHDSAPLTIPRGDNRQRVREC
jgi:hypothetical protein